MTPVMDSRKLYSVWITPIHEVTFDGKIISHRYIEPAELSTHNRPDGYVVVTFRINGQTNVRTVHRVVAICYHGLPPSEKHLVRHLDGNKHNNRADNLAWGTQAENRQDDIKNGVTQRTSQKITKTWQQRTPGQRIQRDEAKQLNSNINKQRWANYTEQERQRRLRVAQEGAKAAKAKRTPEEQALRTQQHSATAKATWDKVSQEDRKNHGTKTSQARKKAWEQRPLEEQQKISEQRSQLRKQIAAKRTPEEREAAKKKLRQVYNDYLATRTPKQIAAKAAAISATKQAKKLARKTAELQAINQGRTRPYLDAGNNTGPQLDLFGTTEEDTNKTER